MDHDPGCPLLATLPISASVPDSRPTHTMALLSIPVHGLWALRPHTYTKPASRWVLFWKNSGWPQAKGPRLCRSGLGLTGLWMLSIHAPHT